MSLEDEQGPQDLTNRIDKYNTLLLSEEQLRDLSKSLAKVIPRHAQSSLKYEDLQHLLTRVLDTASSTNISTSHESAALSSLCGLLDQCSISEDPRLTDLAFEATVWTKAFQIFLKRSENSKAKLVRRLLLTLTGILSKHPNEKIKLGLRDHAVFVCIALICEEENSASIKSAIQWIEHLLSKKLITASDIVTATVKSDTGSQDKLAGKRPSVHSLKEFPDLLSIEAGQDFAFRVLEWVRYPDCAPAISRFLPTFFASLKDDQVKRELQESDVTGSGSPLWITPVKRSLRRHPNHLEIFEYYVLPSLLRVDQEGAHAFLATLPLRSIQRGAIGTRSEADLQLCLLTARMFSRLTHVGGAGDTSAEESLLDLDELGSSLIDHACPSVRIAALSLLNSSSKSTSPFSDNIIIRLRQCVPYLHQETNPRPRNEFIALMKRICNRFRSVVMPFIKHNRESGSNVTISPSLSLPFDGKRNTFKQHSEFLRWYIQFLINELRPTATYQSHITALKVVEHLLDEDLSLRRACSNPCSEASERSHILFPSKLLLRPLLDLVINPFDDVRELSSSILELLLFQADITYEPPRLGIQQHYTLSEDAFQNIFSRAEDAFRRTGRGDHADGVGRLYSLSFGSYHKIADDELSIGTNILKSVNTQLQYEIQLSQSDLHSAVNTAPLHGHLITLR